ncbi:MAG TPA: tetratricopeptide repeat protein [Puia sp.]|nr:tetratricopeptide repeat protein [Puia sp.]
MKVSAPLLALFLSALCAQQAIAQDSLSIRDASEIRHKAESLIKKELNELLNSLSSTSFESTEIEETLHSSYSGTRNKIFRDSMILVEDDINPAFKSSGQSREEVLEKYLKDFDLMYKKSDTASIDFRNTRCSSIKKKDNIYIKVYFNSLFKNKNAISDAPYSENNRVAEIKVDKNGNQWQLYIVRLAFFAPSDTVNDVVNNIPLKHEISQQIQQLAGSPDSATVAVKQQSFDDEIAEKETKRMIEQEKYDQDQYRKMISQGDKAYENNDYPNSLKFYSQARELSPYNPEPVVKIKRTRDAMQQSAMKATELSKEFIGKAQLKEKNRQYKEALENYQQAFKYDPTIEASYKTHIVELNVRYGKYDELNEKYRSGLYKEAIKEYTDAIKADPNNSDYYLGRARCEEKLADGSRSRAKVLEDYNRACALDPNNLEALKYRAEYYTHNNDYFKALTDYKIFLTIDKENIDIYERKAQLHTLLQKNDDAIADLDEALAINPKASHVYYSKGLLLYQKKDYKDANENFTTTLRIESNNAPAWYHRGKCQLDFNNVANAASDFENARKNGIDSDDIRNIQVYAEAFYQRAAAKFNSNKTDSAIVLVDYAISIDPSSSLYQFSRGEYYYALQNNKEAIVSCDKAVLLNSKYNAAFYKRGLAYYNLKDYPHAIDNFTSVLNLNNQDLMALKGKADAYFALNDYSNAANNYEVCLKTSAAQKNALNPITLAEIYNSLGKSYFEKGDLEKALENFKKAIGDNKNLVEAYFNRGHTYYKMGQLSNAIEDLTKSGSFGEEHAQWHYITGKAYQDKKDYTNASANYSKCIRLDTLSRFQDAIYYEGHCYYLAQNYTAALPAYSRALSLQLDTAVSSFNIEMGNVYLNTGKYDSAYLFYDKIYQKDSTNGLATYGIAATLVQKGKNEESLTWFDKSFQTKAVGYSEIKKDKLIANIRDDKKFKALLKKYY